MTSAQLRAFAKLNKISLAEARDRLKEAREKDVAQQKHVKEVLENRRMAISIGMADPIALEESHIVLERTSKPGVKIVSCPLDKATLMSISICKPNEPLPCVAWVSQAGEQYVVTVHCGLERMNEFVVEVDTDHGWLMQICATSPNETLTPDEIKTLAFQAVSSIPEPYKAQFNARRCVTSGDRCPTPIGLPVAFVDEKEIH